ncbi:MAG: hypothetical protein EPN98_21795 [Phenylobacterium sp.]|uniref:hypothetical protein n=1 Tax=Phenylobacterium sp. TaxID=1871053 RepID=UPI0012286CF0|nr:hypothetical protein [Phenylobacterium sp.]TAL29076.1 MAG: hypothetical protein EPN98_21795 [Phenylobacterium sp.]
MARLTDEELSRVLTAHEMGGLVRKGDTRAKAYPACLVQVAKESWTGFGFGHHIGDVYWFDWSYRPDWTVDEFMAQLVARGLA